MKKSPLHSFITSLADSLPCEHNCNVNTYYDYINDLFCGYIASLRGLSQCEFETMLRDSRAMRGAPTKRRFINLISDITNKCLEILSFSYLGDLESALLELERLLTLQSTVKYRLDDILANYFLLKISNHSTPLYRARDVDKNNTVDDCWNIPFDLRYKASKGRFNQTGVVCMYLSDSISLCNKELGKLDENKNRWVQSFEFKKPLCLLNLLIPSQARINDMKPRDQFLFLLLYPFYLLCLSSPIDSIEEKSFVEEYLFSQLLFHVIFMRKSFNNYLSFYDGIITSSVCDKSGYNVIVPSLYNVPFNNNDKVLSDNIRDKIKAIDKPSIISV